MFAGVFPLFVNPMFHHLGIPWAASLLGFIAVALIPIPFLFYVYGLVLGREKSLLLRLCDFINKRRRCILICTGRDWMLKLHERKYIENRYPIRMSIQVVDALSLLYMRKFTPIVLPARTFHQTVSISQEGLVASISLGEYRLIVYSTFFCK